jgi:hypothetical protein
MDSSNYKEVKDIFSETTLYPVREEVLEISCDEAGSFYEPVFFSMCPEPVNSRQT